MIKDIYGAQQQWLWCTSESFSEVKWTYRILSRYLLYSLHAFYVNPLKKNSMTFFFLDSKPKNSNRNFFFNLALNLEISLKMFDMDSVLCYENKSLNNFKEDFSSFEVSGRILCPNVWRKYFLKHFWFIFRWPKKSRFTVVLCDA